jgi:hypothetical protein
VATSGEPDLSPSKAKLPPLGQLLQWTPGIIAALGVFLALLYVVVNSAYVYFYELLGVTPEDVGFDRVAILARTAGLLLPAFILGALIWMVHHYYRVDKPWLIWVVTGICIIIVAVAILVFLFGASNVWPGVLAIVAGFLAFVLYLVCLAKAVARKHLYFAAACWGILLLTLLIGTRASLIALARPSINKALEGSPVKPTQFVDFHAVPARVIWLDHGTKPPILLQDPYLLYLGQGPRGQILLACGNVVAVPSNLVTVEDGFHLIPPTTFRARERFCFRATHHQE